MKTIIKTILTALILIFCNHYTFSQTCNCTEYIYLNEILGAAQVHKFSIDPIDGSLTEVFNNGNTWYPGATVSELPNPHGLVTDLNGNVYVGETPGGDVRKLDCTGNIVPVTDYAIDRGGFNFASEGNTLYLNPGNSTAIEAYDLCTTDFIHEACMNGMATSAEIDWGLTFAPNGCIYASSGYGNNFTSAKVWKITPADFGSGVCVDPILEVDPTGADPSPGDSFLPDSFLRGIVVDENGNIYIVERIGNVDARILKYDANGVFLDATPIDNTQGDGGYVQAQGIVYSETSGYLYVSTISKFDDCVSIIDPVTMEYVGVGVPSPGDGSAAKGIGIATECCPASNNIVIDTMLCNEAAMGDIFLQELLGCDGVICEGLWTEDSSNTGVTFNDCNNAIQISSGACGTFILESDGSASAAQCGPFSITLNIEAGSYVLPTITGTQPTCSGNNDPAPITASGGSASGTLSYQWLMSTTDCNSGFSEIPGETTDSYDPPVLTEETHYRLVTVINGSCSAGACTDTTACVTLIPETDCCPSPNCFSTAITRN